MMKFWLFLSSFLCTIIIGHVQAQTILGLSDSLYTIGKKYYDEGRYSKAIRYFSRCVELDKAEDVPFSIRNEYSSMWLAHCYFLLGENEKAQSIYIYYDATPIDKSISIVSDSLYDKASVYFRDGEYDEAINCLNLCSKYEIQNIGENHIWRSGTLDFLAECFSASHMNDSCLYTLEKSLAIKNNYYGESLPFVEELVNIANLYSYAGDVDSAIRHETLAIGILEKFPEEREKCWNCRISLADFAVAKGDYRKGIEIINEVIEECAKAGETGNVIFITAMNDLASFYMKCGEYENAINCCKDALSASLSISPEKNENYATTLNNLGTIYAVKGEYKEAIRVTEEAKELRYNILGADNPAHAICLNNIARYYSKLGNYAYAIKIEKQALVSYLNYNGFKESGYAASENNLAEYYYLMGDIDAAIETEKEAVEIWSRIYGENHPDYAISLNDLANFYFIKGEYELAISNCEKALSIRRSIWGENHPDYILSLNNLSQYKYGMGKIKDGIELQEKVASLYEQTLGHSHPDYALSLLNLAEMYSRTDSLQKAIDMAEKVASIFASTYGEKGSRYAFCLNMLAQYNALDGRIEETEHYAVSAGIRYNDIVLDNFYVLTGTERPLFWRTYERWYNHEFPNISFHVRTPGILSSLYNSILFSKGILLNAEIEMRKLIMDSGNKEVLSVFDKNQLDRRALTDLLNKPLMQRALDTDSLEDVIRSQEVYLMEKSRSFGNYTRRLSTTWNQVKSCLEPHEVAIEFFLVPLSQDSIRICALVLKRDSQSPEFFDICDEEKIKEISRTRDYESDSLYNLVWKPLEKTLVGIKSVYFAPAGGLYNVAMEYAQLPDSSYINDRYNMFRLSSTRELVEKQSNSVKEAMLYGGLDYDADSTALTSANQRNHLETNKSFIAERAVLESSLSREGLRYLPGTKLEIDTIDAILTTNGVPHGKYEDIYGTEESLKALSGSRIGILHIATHGFYWTSSHLKRYVPFVHSDDASDLFSIEDKALSRSGLFMSGANGAFSGKSLPDYMEDGVLTGQEISLLDFRNLDLVVLSACKTGLGDVTADGVYGLQRAFKKSGAHTIIMSLWNVSDDATYTLMSHFYKNLLSGLCINDSFKESIRLMRRHYSFNEWAGFVILDGI